LKVKYSKQGLKALVVQGVNTPAVVAERQVIELTSVPSDTKHL
jgi:hypothetical protein